LAEATSGPAIIDWGTPDPRDAVAYPSVAGTPPTQWAWEFLRRRDDYRRRWQHLNREQGHRAILGNDATVRSVSRSEADVALGAGETYEWRSPREVLREEFKVYPSLRNETLDPRESGAPLFEGVEVVYEVNIQPEPIVLPKVGIEFDVSLPIEAQLNAARKHLTQKAKEWPSSSQRVKPSRKKFPLYLRLLDFKAAVTKDREIGAHLFIGEEGEPLRHSIRDTLKAARRWQNDYLRIALHSPAAS
jgi:hypothetical protein